MFPELPKDLAALTDEDLAQLHDAFLAVARAVKERDEETLGDRPAEQIVSEMTAGVEAIEAIKAEQTGRAEAEANFNSEIDELVGRAGADAKADGDGEEGEGDGDGDDGGKGDGEGEGEGEGDGEGDGTDTSAEGAREREAVAASASKSVRRPLPAARRHKPTAASTPEGAALLASSQVYPYAEAGEKLDTTRLGQVMSDVINKNRIAPGQKVAIASATYDYPEHRILARDGASNLAKVSLVSEAMLVNTPQSLVASGGLCAPLSPIYDMPDIENASRPVRDALANFRADRGGVIVPTNPVIGDYADAVGTVTEAEDTLGGTYAVKSCMRIECPVFAEKVVDSIYSCIEAGNLTARAYPELMSRIDVLVRANQARLADGKLLTGIKAGSTAVTGVNTTSSAGAVWKLLGHAHSAAAGMRSRHRMSDNARLRGLFPEWLIDLLVVDTGRTQFDRFKARAEIEAILGRANINATFYKDGPSSGTGQVFGAQSAGNLLGFPADTQWALYPEGSWLHLDSGNLDLGIVRDSTLNSTNDFQIFAETWEQVAFIGVESLWITSTLAPNGTVSAAKDFSGSTNF